jgi:hypothetical protein
MNKTAAAPERTPSTAAVAPVSTALISNSIPSSASLVAMAGNVVPLGISISCKLRTLGLLVHVLEARSTVCKECQRRTIKKPCRVESSPVKYTQVDSSRNAQLFTVST